MGAGLAKEFKRRHPNNFLDYRARCQQGRVHLGEPYLYYGTHPFILNFPTKLHWRDGSPAQAISLGFDAIVAQWRHAWRIESLALCPVGAGLGGLDPAWVRNEATCFFADCDLNVTYYERP